MTVCQCQCFCSNINSSGVLVASFEFVVLLFSPTLMTSAVFLSTSLLNFNRQQAFVFLSPILKSKARLKPS
ncbi:hypothetical protein ACJIZ3_010426 [Penstemon smallii]|uniref:Uncharacterized protein n=1 Tax=Penstemon smallii TaxID=265156 RepID=A0ABD3TGX6_9LAMI